MYSKIKLGRKYLFPKNLWPKLAVLVKYGDGRCKSYGKFNDEICITLFLIVIFELFYHEIVSSDKNGTYSENEVKYF